MQKGVVRKRRAAPLSEYGRQLQAKQDLKKEYGMKERQFKRGVKIILAQKNLKEDASLLLMRKLETRLDNVVFRMGLAATRAQARQMVGHGHIFVNKKPVRVPSYLVKRGDAISVAPSAAAKTLFKNAKLSLAKYQAPSWIELNKETMEASVKELPSQEHIQLTVDIPLVFEFYSR